MTSCKTSSTFFEKLHRLYQEMDKEWEEAALYYNFQCSGCSENCCETEFYHHTLIEKQYLLHGFQQLDKQTRKKSIKKARLVNKKRAESRQKKENARIMCPVNENGLCLLYPFRPMICRLHGIPHELRRPGYDPVKMQGCSYGAPLFNAKPYFTFDRTAFYTKMAQIEMQYRVFTRKREKVKQTVAQILLDRS
ncbi:MAG TPA: hypothetical protein VJ936_04880 [Desulfobacteraceae bacterium]|nr:hypothetical protein [Desulfobacteraceae bacterium]